MKEPPAGFDTDRLVQALALYWSLDVRQLEYLALGFGVHHWEARSSGSERYFLTVHELGHPERGQPDLQRLEQALGGARWLQRVAELEFVVGPVVDRYGLICRPVAETLVLSIYPWIGSEPLRTPDDPHTAELLVRLHRAVRGMASGVVRTEDFVIPRRATLEATLADLDVPWNTGPYAEPARELLRLHVRGVRSLLASYDRAVAQARTSMRAWVVTHGEPFGPNLLQSDDGKLHLVDWDSVLVAPRERDLWEVPRHGPAWTRYRQLAESAIDDHLLELYRAWYDLAETAVYVSAFRSRHRGDQNDAQSWENFQLFLPTHERWPGVAPALTDA